MRIAGVVVVVGGGDAIGADLCRILVANPRVTRVYAACRNLDRVQKSVEDLRSVDDPGKKLRVVECDVTRDWSIQNAVNFIACGKVNCLILNTSNSESRKGDDIANAKRDLWQRSFDTNVSANAVVIREMSQLLRAAVKRGEPTTVVSICSVAASLNVGLLANNSDHSFICSQAAMHQLIRLFSAENPLIVAASISAAFGETIKTHQSAQIARDLLRVVDQLRENDSGGLFDHFGNNVTFCSGGSHA